MKLLLPLVAILLAASVTPAFAGSDDDAIAALALAKAARDRNKSDPVAPTLDTDWSQVEDYATLREKVLQGASGRLAIGVPDPYIGLTYPHLRVESGYLAGFSDGVYRCELQGDVPTMSLETLPKTVQQLTSARVPLFSSSCPNGVCPTPPTFWRR